MTKETVILENVPNRGIFEWNGAKWRTLWLADKYPYLVRCIPHTGPVEYVYFYSNMEVEVEIDVEPEWQEVRMKDLNLYEEFRMNEGIWKVVGCVGSIRVQAVSIPRSPIAYPIYVDRNALVEVLR